jgi:hypothetical protein
MHHLINDSSLWFLYHVWTHCIAFYHVHYKLCMFNQAFYLHWSVLCFLKGEKNEQTVEKHNKLRVEVKTTVS